MKLEDLVGYKLMIGVSGWKVTPEILKIFRQTHAGGLILFRRNFRSAKLLKKFISDLEKKLGRKLLVAVDHEGGRVIHLAEGVTVFPDNLVLGNTRNEKYAEAQGRIEAAELRRLGIDLNLAPTLDVLTEKFSPNIGIRSYGRDPELVAKLGAARIKAMQAGGLSACAKHFPGQGQSSLDAHLHFPVLNTSLEEIKKVHLKPFAAAIRAGVDTIMSSHPAYPEVEKQKIVPATFSRKIIHDLLRKELKFKGTILTDDLEMGALREICPIGEAACRAVEAGHDLLLICSKPEAQKEVYQKLLEGYRSGRLSVAELKQSVARIEKLKRKRRKRFSGKVKTESDGKSLAQKIAEEGIKKNEIASPACRTGRSAFGFPRNDEAMVPSMSLRAKRPPAICREGSNLFVIFPRISALNHLIAIETAMLEEEKFLESYFRKLGAPVPKIKIVGIEPTDAEIKEAATMARSAEHTVFFCYDAHLYPKNKELLDAIQQDARNCSVIFLRDPYDKEFLRPNVAYVQAFGFRCVQLEAAMEGLFNYDTMNAVHSQACPRTGREVDYEPKF